MKVPVAMTAGLFVLFGLQTARAWLTDDGQLLKSGLDVLYKGLLQLPRHAPKLGMQVAFRRADGCRQRLAGADCFVVKTDVFNKLIPDDRQREPVQR